ncbi:hypothetical protein F4054_01605 [Candidatus Poribacteria bacterium]|nr:hypothetical protein [Candidatus Poribacteria bacterium]MYK20936.1 hypothetical protein [Candidatus Poribacteria bacterium]
MFIRKYYLPILVFLLLIVGIGLYYLQTRPPKDPIVIIKPVEPLPKSEVKAPVEDTSQGGHFHADGTWHEGPHEPVAETPPAAVRSLSDAELAEIPEDMPEPDIPLPTDLSDSQALNRWKEKYIAEWQKYIHALDLPIKRLTTEIDQMTVELPPENAPDFAAAKAKLLAKKRERHKLGVEKNARVHKSMATTDKLFADNIKSK